MNITLIKIILFLVVAMERYFKKKSSSEQASSPQIHVEKEVKLGPPTKKRFLECDLERLPDDPCLRPKFSYYHPSDRDKVRRYYLQKGSCQPKEINFPQRQFGDTIRKFNPNWYLKYGSWLEYSQKEDATYCLYCYLMRSHVGEHKGSGDVFITEGFTNWKKSERFQVHSDQTKNEYQIHLTAIVDCIRFLLRQELAFRGNDESMSSSNKGNMLELHYFLTWLQKGEISSGHGLNQETTIKEGNTRLSSHYDILLSLFSLFSSMIDVLEIVEEDGISLAQKGEACTLLNSMQTFEFVFTLHLMNNILGITHELSQALQRSDQDIVNAMKLVSVSKQKLQAMRDDGRSRRRVEQVSNLHHFQVELFFQVIDQQLQELNNCFTEANIELLLCVACLNPRDSFSTFDKEKLIRFAQFYSFEFSPVELLALDNQLENYFIDVCFDNAFSKLKGIGDLSMKFVETRKHVLVYLLLELALILPVATASIERAFSAMNIINNRMRNRMEDEWLSDCLVTYIERGF
uniref:TTF-type domain-containing protein n=1 Tax=Cajanus cajan TaxID=3821 RepID=A0A151RWK2_CAJCA|nr:hypothetical protein KK1_031413 [Cajanus cajan]